MLENSLVCVGNKTIDFAKTINSDISFISCKGVSGDGVFSDTSEEETAIRRAFMQNSKVKALLMTQNKFDTTYTHTLCHADEVDFIFSDGDIPEKIKEKLR
jgi:DeoR/GlpR family transcriptional regulator of sugar metabolism